jgi:hypothetical protein
MQISQKYLNAVANADLALARKNGRVCVTGTKAGNLEIEYKGNGYYMISDFNNNAYAHYVGRRAGAVKFLTENYVVVTNG